DKVQIVGTAYNKGRSVLGMFERWIGPEIFRRGLLDYMKRHAWESATADDLWGALSRASGKDVQGTMAGFLEQPTLPLVTVEPLSGGRVRLSQRRFVSQGTEAPPLRWSIPVLLKYSDGKSMRTLPVLLSEAAQEVLLGGLSAPPAWIFPAADAVAYYRWS